MTAGPLMSVHLTADAHVRRAVGWFESMTPASLDGIGRIYADDARFEDPFSRVQGVAAIRHLYERMFATLQQPRFTVVETLVQDVRCVLVWDFRFRRGARAQRIRGTSLLRFAADGRIAEHIDHWDAASQVYAHVPVLGAVIRWLGRRIG
jgi:ketosteroid isomerase-like protein